MYMYCYFVLFSIWHLLYVMILLPLGFMFINPSYITYICEQNIPQNRGPFWSFGFYIYFFFSMRVVMKRDMKVTFSVILSKQFNQFLFIPNASIVSDEWRMDNKRSGVGFPTVHIQSHIVC